MNTMTRDAKRPTLEAMQTLVLFAERGELAAVAKALGLDQAVISRRLSDLRVRFGLVAKRGRSLTLTETGRAALPAFRSLLRQHGQVADWLAQRQDRPRALAVGTGGFGARFYLPGALARLSTSHPDVRVRVQVRRGRERVLGTADGTYDLAVVTHDEWQVHGLVKGALGESARLRVQVIAEHPLALVAGRGTPIGLDLERSLQGQPFPTERLAGLDLIGPDPQAALRRQIEGTLAGRAPRFVLEAGGWEAARECARHGLGAAIVPLAVLARDDRDDLVVRRLENLVVRDSLIARDAENEVEPALAALGRAVADAASASVEDVRRRWQGLVG